MRRSNLLMFLALTAACSGDTSDAPITPEFAEICGQSGPVKLLALDPDRALASTTDHGMFGQRRVLGVDYFGGTSIASATPPVDGRALWSVGPCGEDPQLISEDRLRVMSFDDAWPGQLFTCDWESGAISIVDPSGARPSNVVFESDRCFTVATDEGVVSVRPDGPSLSTGALVLQPWPDDPWTTKAEAIVLLDSIRTEAEFVHRRPSALEVMAVTDTDYLVITSADELVSLSRIDAELTTIATDARTLAVDSTGRYLAWQGTEITAGEPGSPEGPIFVHDRATDVITPLTEGMLPSSAFVPESRDVLRVEIRVADVQRIYRLPNLESIDLPLDVDVWRGIGDSQLLTQRGPYQLLDLDTAQLTTLYEGNGQPHVMDDALYVLEGIECCLSDERLAEVAPILRIPFEGDHEPEVVAERASVWFRFTPDGRVLTTLDAGEGWVGSLIVVDPDTLEEQQIGAKTLRLWPSSTETIEGDPLVVYARTDAENTGIWLARLDTP